MNENDQLLAERRAHAVTIKKLAKRDERIRELERELRLTTQQLRAHQDAEEEEAICGACQAPTCDPPETCPQEDQAEPSGRG